MNKNNNAMFMFLILIIGIGLLSLYVSTIITNAQASSGFASGGSDSDTGYYTLHYYSTTTTQMGICVVGVASPCNGVN